MLKTTTDLKLIPIKGWKKLVMAISYFEEKEYCYIEAECSKIQLKDTFSGQNFKDALLKLRQTVEPKGYKIACSGCLKNAIYSGQLLRSGKGLSAYMVTDINKPVDITQRVGSLSPVDKSLWKELSTIEEQKSFKKLYVDNAIKNSDQWARESAKKRQVLLEKQKKSRLLNKNL